MSAKTKVLLGITGGIAAYKSAEIARLLIKRGCHVKAVLTQGAQQFITPLTLQALTGEPTRNALLDEASEAAMGHIELARWADHILIAPSTAHMIAKLAHGWSDDLLSTLCLATRAPITLAPAMNHVMWMNAATQANLSILVQRGIDILGPEQGEQACGETGTGRLMAPELLVDKFVGKLKITDVDNAPARKAIATKGKPTHWVITAGPTQEAIDPVRYLSNRSSGKMGFAIAEAAAQLGHQVTLISGPTSLPTPANVTNRIDVKSAQEMLIAADNAITPATEIFVAAAAVSDYRCASIAADKIKKDSDTLSLNLVKNPDIVHRVAQRTQCRPKLVVGFAAETQSVEAYARDKLLRKGLDLIIANDVSQSDIGFDSDYNQVQVISKNKRFSLGPATKVAIGQQIVHAICGLL